ncbi:hypothetical protein J7M28_04610 [bacterium]|nr:hypothetical protein [bacterium]
MTRSKSAIMILVAITTLVCVGLSFGQPFGFFGDDWAEKGKAKRRETRELLSTVYLMELTKELALDKTKAVEIAAVLSKEEKAKEKRQDTIRKTIRELRHELGNDKPSKKKLKNLIESAKAARDEMQERARIVRDKILSKLSVQQQAKFILFHIKWIQKVQRIREHIRGERMRERGGDGPGPGQMRKGPNGRRGMR